MENNRKLSEIGVAGLAVMGENLALNLESRGYSVAVFNRTSEKVDRFLKGRGKGKNFTGAATPREFCEALNPRPRKILMMVKAGAPVDELIGNLLPHLEPGDILIDGGNSFYRDSERRCAELQGKGILFVGAGISGGEEGALHGPSIMPGGNKTAWKDIESILKSIAAKAPDGTPCCEWVGPGGAGHFVKMVHNGIEYADMQMISEAYFLMRKYFGLDPEKIAETFRQWDSGDLESYLIRITADILAKKDPVTKKPMVDVILDAAGQKGTGKWTAEAALDLGISASIVAEAVFARAVSTAKEERLKGEKILASPLLVPPFHKKDTLEYTGFLGEGLYASKICSYAQGFRILRAASERFNWNLNCADVASLWRGGCIIRAKFLDDISEAFRETPQLENLLFAQFFRNALARTQTSWRTIVQIAALAGIPMSAFSSALCYYDSCRTGTLPAALIQAQRDYFGAHTFERTDRPRGEFHHFEWTVAPDTEKIHMEHKK